MTNEEKAALVRWYLQVVLPAVRRLRERKATEVRSTDREVGR
jgi:hypothetical protein